MGEQLIATPGFHVESSSYKNGLKGMEKRVAFLLMEERQLISGEKRRKY